MPAYLHVCLPALLPCYPACLPACLSVAQATPTQRSRLSSQRSATTDFSGTAMSNYSAK